MSTTRSSKRYGRNILSLRCFASLAISQPTSRRDMKISLSFSHLYFGVPSALPFRVVWWSQDYFCLPWRALPQPMSNGLIHEHWSAGGLCLEGLVTTTTCALMCVSSQITPAPANLSSAGKQWNLSFYLGLGCLILFQLLKTFERPLGWEPPLDSDECRFHKVACCCHHLQRRRNSTLDGQCHT